MEWPLGKWPVGWLVGFVDNRKEECGLSPPSQEPQGNVLAIPNPLSAQTAEDSCDVKTAQAPTSPHPRGVLSFDRHPEEGHAPLQWEAWNSVTWLKALSPVTLWSL